jgi:hypothetical protein
VKALVKNGRLVLDEPTALPEGTEVELAPVDADDLDDDERQRLHEALAASDDDFARGRHRAAEDVISDLRSRRR